MPLDENDTPREDGADDSFADSTNNNYNHNQPINNNHDDDDEDDDNFNFSSDDNDDFDDDIQPINNVDRYANYQLLGQANGPNEFRANGDDLRGLQSSESDNEESNNNNNESNNDQFYQHNAVIQWIETDQPLFNREEFEQHQRRRQQQQQERRRELETTSNNSQLSESTDNQIEHIPQQPTVQNNDDNSIESSTQLNQQLQLNVPSSSSNSVRTQPQQQQSTNSKVNLDKDKIDTIKNLMSNFKLPTESIPDWANNFSNDDQWKNFLDDRIKKNEFPNEDK